VKKLIGFILLGIAIITVYSVFFYENSKYVAGEYRYYTSYEKYKAQDKVVDYGAPAYMKDKYNLARIKERIERRIESNEFLGRKINLLIDSLNYHEHTISDLNGFIDEFSVLRMNFKNQQGLIENDESDLQELDNFIIGFESGLVSIKFYQEDILNMISVLNQIDSTSDEYISTVNTLDFIVTAEKQSFIEEIVKQVEKEQLETLAQTQKSKESEAELKDFEGLMKNESNSTYSSDYYDNYVPSVSTFPSVNTYSSKPNYVPHDYPVYPSHSTNSNHVYVKGYYKSNGTYVKPYVRTAPNSTLKDNFSTSPNINPYTGEKGSVKFEY
jgi:hypothetical protein